MFSSRLGRALFLVACLAPTACSNETAPSSASAEGQKTSASAAASLALSNGSASAAPGREAAPKAESDALGYGSASGTATSTTTGSSTAAAPTLSAPTTPPAPPAPSVPDPTAVGIMRYVPAQCEAARIYANLGKILSPEAYSALETFFANALGGQKDAAKTKELVKILRDGGIDPVKGMRELAICASSDESRAVNVSSVDMSKAKDPAEVFAKALEKLNGSKPASEVVNGVTILEVNGGKGFLAVVGKDTLIGSQNKDVVKALLKGDGSGAAAFGDAVKHLAWAKVSDKNVEVVIDESGKELVANVKMTLGKDAAGTKDMLEKQILVNIDKLVEKMPLLKPLLPLAKNAKIEVKGDDLLISTHFPKSAINELIVSVKDLDLAELRKKLPAQKKPAPELQQ